MHDEARRLDTLAASQDIDDAEVAHCWELVRKGIQTRWLGLGNLGRVIEHLRAGSGMGIDELMLEIVPDAPDRALVTLLDDERTCPASKLIAELERLVERAGGQTSDAPDDTPDDTSDDTPGAAAPPRPAQAKPRRLSLLEWVIFAVLVLLVALLLAELERP